LLGGGLPSAGRLLLLSERIEAAGRWPTAASRQQAVSSS
jgi:hypothetical protein